MIPAYLECTGQPYLLAYLWVWMIMMGTVLAVSLVLYNLEGRPFTWKTFAARYRLASMARKDWLWVLVVFTITAGFYFGLRSTAEWFGAFPIFGPPPLAPVELTPGATENITPGIFFGMPVRGQWWVVLAYFTGWVCNILGEEFFYRGWMLPRQEQPFNFLAIWPGLSSAEKTRGSGSYSMG